MSGASEVPAIPEDVIRKHVNSVNEQSADAYDAWFASNGGGETSRAHWKRRALAAEAELAARPVDTGREKALEERKDRERQIRVSEYRRAVEWLHGRAKAMNDPHARAVLDLAGDEYGRSRSRALANPENGRG